MKILIAFRNPKTGEVKQVKCGWSWTLFLWSGVLGIPLFLRKLNVWGSIYLVLWAWNAFTGPLGTNGVGLQWMLGIVFVVLAIWLGLKGNEMTAKNYLERNWVFEEPDSEFTKMAKQQWGITISARSGAAGFETAPLSQDYASQPVFIKRSNNWIFISIAIVVVVFGVSGLCLYTFVSGVAEEAELGSNGLPKCDSEQARDTAKGAIEGNALKKLVTIEVISFEKITTLSTVPDGSTTCNAEILTNTGRQQKNYTISKTADGNYYVEAEIL